MLPSITLSLAATSLLVWSFSIHLLCVQGQISCRACRGGEAALLLAQRTSLEDLVLFYCLEPICSLFLVRGNCPSVLAEPCGVWRALAEHGLLQQGDLLLFQPWCSVPAHTCTVCWGVEDLELGAPVPGDPHAVCIKAAKSSRPGTLGAADS